uniref:Secreted protein n=1 Tax=Syphacia muris TaxID=451379 RepID=A0A0N5B155_9BILA
MNGILALLLFALAVDYAVSCDIIVHIKSNTTKKFNAQVIAPNGKKSELWSFNAPREKKTFQQKASECGIKDWEIMTKAGTLVQNVKVKLNGIGRVTYIVGDDLKPTQTDRQGAECKGQCAPLGKVPAKSRSPSPTPKPKI